MKPWILALAFACIGSMGLAHAQTAPQLTIALSPAPGNPTSPEMGNWMHFRSVVRNTGAAPAQSVVAWIGLVRVDAGHEQPMDLEDWSAHKAVVIPSLQPGQSFTTEWPMRLIQNGDYRVVISAAERHAQRLDSSPFLDLHVRVKPTVESRRILPVAIGVPLLLGLIAGLRLRRRA